MRKSILRCFDNAVGTHMIARTKGGTSKRKENKIKEESFRE